MAIHPLPQWVLDASQRLMNHLPATNDLTLIVLKGHLLIEEQLLALLKQEANDPSAIDGARLRYSQLHSVAKALYYEQGFSWFSDAAAQLNGIRNALVHQLEPIEIEKRTNALVARIEHQFPGLISTNAQSSAESLRFSISLLHGALVGLRGGRALKASTPEAPPAPAAQ